MSLEDTYAAIDAAEQVLHEAVNNTAPVAVQDIGEIQEQISRCEINIKNFAAKYCIPTDRPSLVAMKKQPATLDSVKLVINALLKLHDSKDELNAELKTAKKQVSGLCSTTTYLC